VPTLVHYWVKLDVLDPVVAGRGLVLGGLALALQWPAGLYASGMTGLHKQTQLSVVTSVFATSRIVLTVGILSLVNPTLEAFFWAQITWALVQSVGMRFMLWHSLKLKEHKPLIKLSIIREKLHFAGGMTGIALTSIVLTQMDKLVMSHTLALKDFGVYVLSSTLAFGLYMVISPLFSVIYPRLSALIYAGNDQTVAEQFHLGSQMMAVLVIPAAVTIALFSKQILYIWTGNISISEQGAGVLSLLVIGNACNGIMNIPYALQLASGWTSLSFWINVGAILFLTPATWFFATKYGAIGGAAVWCALNVGYVFLTPHLMHKRLLQTEKMSWYMRDIFPPVLVAAAAIALLWGVDLSGLSWLQLAICITFFWVASTMFSLLVLQRLRERFATYVTTQVIRWLKHG
jgi:O-antigen/teichoic acid export membrane protein